MGIIEQFIFQKDVEICSNGLWTLSNLLNSTDDVIEKIASDYIMKRVLNLLDHPDMMVKAPALRCIGNISSGKSEFTKKLWSFGAIKKLEPLLDNKKPGIRREACWTISNFLAEDANIVASVFDTQILQKLIGKVFSDVDDVRIGIILIF